MNGTAPMEELARGVVQRALEWGATGAECTVAQGDEFSVTVRKGEVDTLKEAGSGGAGLRVLVGKRSGSAYTSDLSPAGLEWMIRSAIELAKVSTEDPLAGLPDPEELGAVGGDLQLYSEDVETLTNELKIAQARAAEEAAFAADDRIRNSEGAGFETYRGSRAFASSAGFSGSYRSTSCSLSVTPVAEQDGRMERDCWWTASRRFAGLEPPELVGRTAAERAVRRLGSRPVPTCKASVVFDPRTARTLLESIFEAVHGELVYRKASFLADKLGEKVASDLLTVIDDGTLAGLPGTAPFDDEGVPTRRTVIIERGVLKSYLLNAYTARKLGLKTTGNASRGLAGNSGIGHGNLYIEKGSLPPEELIRRVKRGLYVTELLGFGVNIVTGDYSRGAAGIWIENGELAYPVSEVTIAGNLREMLHDVEAVGSDLEFRTSIAAPTLVCREMTISGH